MHVVQKAVWCVESRSREELSLAGIAETCGVSPFHLTRAFAEATGSSLMRYVRARRLSEAARRLAAGADDILAVALDAGYGSHEAFTRAFRDAFDRTPEQLRAEGRVDHLSITEAILLSTTPMPELDPARIVALPARTLVGLTQRYSMKAPAGIPDQWQQFAPHLGHIPGHLDRTAYGACYDFDGEGNFSYMCAVELTESAATPDGMTALALPAQTYAVFTHPGHIAGIRATINAVWQVGLPASGRKPTAGAMLERYGPRFDPRAGLGDIEIWVPVEA